MPNLASLTERQREIYNFIKEKIESRGYGPTVREIGAAFDIRSPNGVMCHLKALVKKGLISREGRSARAITLVDYHPGASGLPYVGRVAAGSPTLAIENAEWLEFNDLFGGKNHFVLKVKGESMIDDHIQDGDYVVIKKQESAHNGQRVVAMIDNEVTLKKFYKDRNRIRLEPSNGDFDPIIVRPGDHVKILGVLIGVLRRC
jgi:repressor LexA